MGLEKLHPFDSAKFKKVLGALIKEKLVASEAQTVLPTEASMELLGDVHTQEYLKQVHTNNLKIVQVCTISCISKHKHVWDFNRTLKVLLLPGFALCGACAYTLMFAALGLTMHLQSCISARMPILHAIGGRQPSIGCQCPMAMCMH